MRMVSVQLRAVLHHLMAAADSTRLMQLRAALPHLQIAVGSAGLCAIMCSLLATCAAQRLPARLHCCLSAYAVAKTHLLCSPCLLLLPYLSSHLLHLLLPSSLDLLALQLACSHPLARLDRLLFQNAVVHHKLQQRTGVGTQAATVARPAHTPGIAVPPTHSSGHILPFMQLGCASALQSTPFQAYSLGTLQVAITYPLYACEVHLKACWC